MRGTAAHALGWRCVVALVVISTRAGGQSSGARVSFTLGAMGVGVVTRAAPAVFGATATEGALTQPNVMAEARRGVLTATGTLNLEGYTLRRGELNAGIYGEGYVDRRHPHTLAHELMLSVQSPGAMRWRGTPLRASLSAGKGFTPFGTDDPMMRPLEKYPVNHHHAQIIERVQVIGALMLGDDTRGVAVEHAVFNGDEPVGPFIGPQWRRLGDSRTTRVTVMPRRGVELQASRAFVRSPGITQGGAFDHRQTSVSLRLDSDEPMAHEAMAHEGMAPEAAGTRRYLLAEFARTDEGFGTTPVFRFSSLLVEGLLSRHEWQVALRGERTERPENERLLDPFRTANGHIDFQIIGVTRWSIGTLQVDAPPLAWPVAWPRAFGHPHGPRASFAPFVAVALAHPVARRSAAVFVPREFYGASALWSLSAGVRLHAGAMRARMGRYGVLAAPAAARAAAASATVPTTPDRLPNTASR